MKHMITLVIIATLLFTAACTQVPTGNVTQTTQPIKLGVSAPLSGEAASYGEHTSAGIELAVKEINDAGGINGRKIELIFEDDKCSREGINTLTKLVEVDQVDAIIGPVCSAAAGPGLPSTVASGTPVMLIASAPALTSVGDNVFRIYPSDAFAGKFLAEHVYTTMGKKKAAVVYVQNDWGKGIRDTFTQRYKELGGQILVDEGLSQDTKDTRTTLAKIKASGAEVAVVPLYPGTGVSFIKQAKESGMKIPIIGGDAFEGDEVVKSGIADGVIFVSAKIRLTDDFKAKIKAATGTEPNIFSPLGYDAVKVYAEVIKQVGTDKQAMRDALYKLKYSGASNPDIQFDSEGDLKSASYDVKVIRNNKAEVTE